MSVRATDARAWVLAACGVGLGAGITALILGGGAPAPAQVGITDPGPVVGWGLIAAQATVRVSAIVVIGLLVTAAWLLPGDGPRVRGRAAVAVQWAGRWSMLWAAATLVYFVAWSVDLFPRPLSAAFDLTTLRFLAESSAPGRGLVYQFLVAAAIVLVGRWVTSVRGLTFTIGLAVTALVPAALAGHASGAGSHDLAVIALTVHLVAAAIWLGGLVGLLWVAWRGSVRLAAAARRFSGLAIVAVVALALSGLVSAMIRLGDIGGVATAYGTLVLSKTALMIVLVVLGAVQRQVAVAQIGEEPAGVARFARLASLEVVILGAVVGLSVALSRTQPPGVSEILITPGEQLLGRPVPPAPDLAAYLWNWYPSGLGLLLLGLGVGLYATGVVALRRRGIAWSWGRTLCWSVGMVIIGWATVGGLGVYSGVMFSTHMVAHMMLSMVAPIFLVLGAPMTLALRTLPGPRRPGEVSPRKLLNDFLHSRFSRVMTHPLVAATLFVGSLYAVYFTGLFESLMRNHWGHVGMEVHFLAAGFLFYYVIIGVDPSPRRIPYPARFAILFVTIPFHAFFAIALMQSTTVVAEAYYLGLGRSYATDLAADQYLGASLAWAMGEIPLVAVLIALFTQWFRSDRRESKRHDRSEARSEDAELAAYNAYLAQLSRHTEPR